MDKDIFLQQMTQDMDFQAFWDTYQPDEARFPNRKLATYRLWLSRIRPTQHAMLAYVKNNGIPKWKNPYFWVQDFGVPHPTNYNGARSLPDEPLVRAIYNGTGGLYSDAKRPLSSGANRTFILLLSCFCAYPQPGERNHKRACKILRLYCQGLSEREISDKLKISQPTVHQHLERAVERLKAITKRL